MRVVMASLGILAALPALAADLSVVPDGVMVERPVETRAARLLCEGCPAPGLPHGGLHRPHVPALPYGGLRKAHAPDLPYGRLGRAHAPDLPYGGLGRAHAPDLPYGGLDAGQRLRRVRSAVVSSKG